MHKRFHFIKVWNVKYKPLKNKDAKYKRIEPKTESVLSIRMYNRRAEFKEVLKKERQVRVCN